MRKGLTPIIAMVLLLMMAVAAAGLMYTFAFNLQTKAQEGVEQTTTELIEQQQQYAQTRLAVDSVYNTSSGNIGVVIRNVGSKTIAEGETIGLYIDGVKQDLTGTTCDNLAPQNTCVVQTNTAFPAAGEKSVIRVVAPSGVSTTYTCYSDGERC